MMNRVVALSLLSLMAASARAEPPGGAAQSRFDAEVAATKAVMMTEPEEALRHAEAAESAAAKMRAGGSGGLAAATAGWLRGEATTRTGRPQAALPILNKALTAVVALAPSDKLHGDILLSRGWIEASTGQVQQALQDFQEAHNILRAAGDTRGQSKALQNIGSIYHDAGDNQRSLGYYAQAAELAGSDQVIALAAHNNVGETLKALGRYRQAGVEYGLAVTAARKLGSQMIEVHILTNLAAAQLSAGAVREADATARRSLALARKVAANDERPFALGVLAQIALKRGQIDQAATLITQTFAGQNLQRTPLAFRDFHAAAAEIFERLGRHDLAYAHLAGFKRLDDDARALAASTNSALMAARFDFANQDLRIARLSAGELKLRSLILSVALGAAGVIFVLLLIGFLSIRRSRNEVRAANAQLTDTNVSLEKALAAKTEFLATTSHEIRTPLNGILGTTQVVLADRRLDGWLREKVEMVHSAGETMRALVDDILDVAKIETGELTLRDETVPLQRLLNDAARFWSAPAELKGLEMRVALADCPAAIRGDEARLRQIVFNLMSNAVKFTPAGWVSLAVALVPDPAGDRLQIRVEDSGIGIPHGLHEAIFDKFYQVDSGTSRQFAGTGLGLAICRSLAEAMEGTILVESTLDNGSCFHLDLPLRLDEALANVADEHATDHAAMLIVEPNALNQRLLAKGLKRIADKIETVTTIEMASALLPNRSFRHVIVQLDAGTPRAFDMLGEFDDFLAAARRRGCATVALFSPGEITADALIRSGWTYAIAKPVTPAGLANAIEAMDTAKEGQEKDAA